MWKRISVFTEMCFATRAVRSLFFVEVKTPRESFFSNDVKMYSAGCGAGGEYNLPTVCFFREGSSHVIIGYVNSFFFKLSYFWYLKRLNLYTLPETNIAPEKWWLGNYFPFGARPTFTGYVSFREGTSKHYLFLLYLKGLNLFLNLFCFNSHYFLGYNPLVITTVHRHCLRARVVEGILSAERMSQSLGGW